MSLKRTIETCCTIYNRSKHLNCMRYSCAVHVCPNANVYEYHIHHWWFSILCCGSVVATVSATLLQCHLMSWIWPLQSMLLLQAVDLMAEGKHGTAVSRPLTLYKFSDDSWVPVSHTGLIYIDINTTITPHFTCPWVLYISSQHSWPQQKLMGDKG